MAALPVQRPKLPPRERHPNRVRERPSGRSQEEVRISKRAARYARPYIFGMDD